MRQAVGVMSVCLAMLGGGGCIFQKQTPPCNPTVITVSPPTVALSSGQTQTFSAAVQGCPNPQLYWSIQEGTLGGSITNAGVYTAPSKAGTYHVLATVLSLSGTATVNVGTPVTGTTVSGSVVTHWVYQGTQTDIPSDLSASTIYALAPATGSFVSYPGSGTTSGTFSIPNVPDGGFYVTLDGLNFLWTSRTALDLSSYAYGRSNAVFPKLDGGAAIAIDAGAMTAFQQYDDFELISEGAGLDNSSLLSGNPAPFSPTPDAGATALFGTVNYVALYAPLIDAVAGDVTYLTHLSTVLNPQDAGTQMLLALSDSLSTAKLSVINGATSLLWQDFTHPAQTAFGLSDPGTALSGWTGSVNPAAVGSYDYLVLQAEPETATHGPVTHGPNLLTYSNWGPPSTNVPVSANYGNPFPSPAWTPFVSVSRSYAVDSLIFDAGTGGTSTYAYSAGTAGYEDTLAAATARGSLAPANGPVLSPLINGVSLFATHRNVGTTPTLSWTAPAAGANEYFVTIYKMLPSPTNYDPYWAGTLGTSSATTSLTVPPGLLTVGSPYIFVISAQTMPNTVFDATPWQFSFPISWADAVSDVMYP